MRSVMTAVFVTLAGATLLEAQGGKSPGVECGGPGALSVRITAQQLSEAPPSYAFLVTNLAQGAITGVVIGRQGRVMSIVGVAPQLPVPMGAPPRLGRRPQFLEWT